MTRRPRSSSSSFSTKKFDVFEFNDEDHSIEKVSKRILRKFQNPSKSRSSPVTKYDFLQAFASGSNCRPVSIDITADHINLDDEQEEVTRCSAEELADQPLEVVIEVVDDDDGRGHDDGYDREKIDTQSLIDTPLPLSADKEISGCSDFVESDFDSKNRSLGVASDDDDDDASQMSYSSTSSSNPPEDEVDFGDQLVEHDDSAAFVINVEEKVVDVIPDFIQFEDLYSTRSKLTFSCNSLKLEGSTSNGTRETLKIEWPTEDIIKIESCWFENIETALINLLLKSKDYSEDGNRNQNPVYADFKLLKFAVYDSFWYKAEEAIKLLDTRYTDIWSTHFNIDVDNSGSISALGQHYFFSQNRYFPNFDEAFDEVIYPKGEPDAVSISKRDVELLQPQTFINDTIIDFYIKYLKNKLPTDEQDRFHFFNSFFFRKLADLDKDPASACDGRAAFQRVRKWTRKVNLFEKDYILIPINYSLHWSLIAICHPGEVTCYQDEEMNESSKIPCILHMDSLQGTHKGLKNIFQSYLCEEWKERHGNVVDDVSSKFLHMRFISLELPQQDNLYDCGLFLLHYVERFLEEAPVNFNPFMITKFSDFLTSNWFPPPEASLKRSHIQNLIYDIFENNSLQARPTDCLDKGLPSEDPAIVVQTKVEEDSLTGCSYSDLWCVKDPLNSSTELETADIQYPTASPGRVSPCMGGPALVSKDWRVISRSDCLQMSAYHKRGFLSPLKEIDECSEETAVSVEREKSQLVYDFPSTSYVRKDHGASESSEHGLSVNFMKAVDDHSLSRTCTRLSSFPMNTSTHEDQLLKKNDESKIEDKTIVEYPSTSGEELTDYVVPDSPAANDADVSFLSHSSFLEYMNSLTTHQILDFTQKRSLEEDTIVNKEKAVTFQSDREDAKRPNPMNAYVVPDSPGADDGHDADISIVESPSSFREYEPDAKRPKLMNQDGAPRRMLTRSMLKGACVL
ncbi:probable ubiquitin-like-specific protease 2A isoform X2 [Vigna angularis]|uniref:probable ubiquitin-like-specific protease 2A isoform X2 n=1 Tax=Phaseolus angularis TaxID=3914 RepID=UPI0022B37155|nr:probable ubiquitin-like-specific protease 2A isoform X2 [Vigna angularis]